MTEELVEREPRAERIPAVDGHWVGLLSLALAAVSVVTFVGFMLVAGPVPKSIVYNPNLLYEIYMELPLVSAIAGVLSVVLAVVELRRTRGALGVAALGTIAAILLFFFVAIIAGNLVTTLEPPTVGPVISARTFPVIALSPLIICLTALLIGVAVLLVRLPSSRGHRPAIGALVTSGAVTSFWLLSLALQNLGGE